MAEDLKRAIVVKLQELTDSGKQIWKAVGMYSYSTTFNEMTVVISWDTGVPEHILDIHEMDVHIDDSDFDGNLFLLDGLYKSIVNSLISQSVRDPEANLKYVLDILNRA